METHPRNVRPPKWPTRILRIFLKKEYLEEIEGDMEELFQENVALFSPRKARRMYAWDMFGLMRPVLMKNLEVLHHLNQLPMFKNYFKVSLRGLMRNPLNSFINVFGLSLAIGFCIFGYAFAQWSLQTDQFHKNKHTVHLITSFMEKEGVPQQFGKTPRPLAEMLRQDFAHIRKVCRIEDRNVVIKFDDHVFHERVRYTDPDFLDMFTFPLKWGTPSSLKEINNVILSEKMSVKYFGDANPVGQTIVMIYGKDQSKAFNISGVAAEFPKSRTISFDFLINFENLRTTEPNLNLHDWNGLIAATLIQVDKPSDVKVIGREMDKFIKLQNEAADNGQAISTFGFEPLATLHEQSEYIRDDISKSSKNNYISIMFMSGISLFLLALACVNYINIAIVTATKRFREIGVRKSIGATRRTIIVQFLSENILITFFALLVGLAIGYTFFIPGFEYLWNFDMGFNFSDHRLWIFLPAVLILTSIASGIYPSLYISKFQVVSILKGSLKFGQKNPTTKILLGFQLILAFVFITCAIMFTQNTSYLAKRSWGYDPHHILYAKVTDQAAYEQLKNAMSERKDVLGISGSRNHIGKSHEPVTVRFPDREYEADQLSVDATYIETMGLRLKEGRNFRDYEGSDRQGVIVNEAFAENMGWQNAVGQQFRIDSVQHEVIGVLKEFHNYSFDNQVKPMIFKLAAKTDLKYLSLRVNAGSEMKTYEELQSGWAKLFPEIPFEGGHQEDVWGFYFREIEIYDLVWQVLSVIAVSLATLGLYGLVRLNVSGRTKEFSIRKILGAGLTNIAINIFNQYTILFILSLVAGACGGYMFSSWLIVFAYEYHMPITFSGTMIATAIMIIILVATVSTQIKKVAKANPVDGLKTE
jgi:putative ABC transport system permease protein